MSAVANSHKARDIPSAPIAPDFLTTEFTESAEPWLNDLQIWITLISGS